MEEIFGKAVPLIQLVLPGFVTTVIFYWLSNAPKPGQFERLIQALIGTGVIYILVRLVESLALYAGRYAVIGGWGEWTDLAWSYLMAIALGLGLAFISANDTLYKLARRLNLTMRFSEGSEWCFAHRTLRDRGVTLNFYDGRRLAGYPRAWPTCPEKGHYLIQFPTWIVADESDPETQHFAPAEGVDYMLIPSSEIIWIDFLSKPKDEGVNNE